MWNHLAIVGALRTRCLSGSLVVGVCAVLMAASSATAVQLAYDAFLIGSNPSAGEYQPGPLFAQAPYVGPFFGNNPWIGSVESPIVETFMLADSAWASPNGGHVATLGGVDARAGRPLAEPWTDNTQGTFYLSYLVNFGSLPPEDQSGNMGFREVEFWDPSVTSGSPSDDFLVGSIGYNGYYSAFGPVQMNPETARMEFNFGGSQIVPDSPTFNEDGATHFMVLKFELSDLPASDSVSLFLDPVIAIPVASNSIWPGSSGIEEPAIPSATATGLDFKLGAIGAVSLFGSSGTFPAMDEMRVGTELVDVLPESVLPPPVSWEELYEIIVTHMNQQVTGGPYEGDIALADGTPGSDGQVTIADFGLWKDNPYDSPPVGAVLLSVAVSEPASLVLAAAAFVALLGYSRTRQAST